MSAAMVLTVANTAAADVPVSTKGAVRGIPIYANSTLDSSSAYSFTGSNGNPSVSVTATFVKVHSVTGERKTLYKTDYSNTVAGTGFSCKGTYICWSITGSHKGTYQEETWTGKTQAKLYN